MDLDQYRNQRLRRKRPLLRSIRNPVSVSSGGATLGSGGAPSSAPAMSPSNSGNFSGERFSFNSWYSPWWWWNYSPYLYNWGWPMGFGYTPPYQPYYYPAYSPYYYGQYWNAAPYRYPGYGYAGYPALAAA